MNTHGQTVDSQGRVHVVMWHCTDESLRVAGSKPGEHRWGPAEARRNHHYWRDRKGDWHHRELPGVAGTRPKIFVDKHDNAYVVYADSWDRGFFFPEGGPRGNAAAYSGLHLRTGLMGSSACGRCRAARVLNVGQVCNLSGVRRPRSDVPVATGEAANLCCAWLKDHSATWNCMVRASATRFEASRTSMPTRFPSAS